MSVIVTARPPRRKSPAKAAMPVEIKAPRVVEHTPRRQREPKPLEPDPEAEARVAAFFARMIWAALMGDLPTPRRIGLLREKPIADSLQQIEEARRLIWVRSGVFAADEPIGGSRSNMADFRGEPADSFSVSSYA